MSCGVCHRCGSDLALLWLWYRPAAKGLIGPIAWEPLYAMGAALKRQKDKKTKKKKKERKKERKRMGNNGKAKYTHKPKLFFTVQTTHNVLWCLQYMQTNMQNIIESEKINEKAFKNLGLSEKW